MSDSTQTIIRKQIEAGSATSAQSSDDPISIRVSPNSYLIALLLGTFFSAFLFYLELDLLGIAVFIAGWIFVPFFALNDHVVFDGKRLTRSGVVPTIWSWLYGSRRRLKLTEIEQIETEAIRTIKRGGNIYYRYRTAVRGRDIQISFTSGNENYRQMIKSLLPRVSEYVLDNRSVELRDHLEDPKETLMKAEFEQIPSAEFLRSESGKPSIRSATERSPEIDDLERAEYLRVLGNELRLNGYLHQAVEAFRRALVIRPLDGRLLFEFGRCLHSLAGTERQYKLERRAIAAFRLAGRRASDDGDLLARLGEAYFHAGEWGLASKSFQRALDQFGEGFRTARGLAEIALREGKIAHVIHHFSTANRLAETPAVRRWTRGEAEYFSNLNKDDEYMELEVNRVQMLETLDGSKRTALRITMFGFPAIFAGVLLDDTLVANVGWAVSAIALLVWTGMNISIRLLSTRIPYELVESDD